MTPAITSPISQQQVHQWHSAFLQLNKARLECTRSLMTSRQQIVLDVLPLLLHLNHQQLPGFIDHQVPCGIAHYNASAQQLQSLQSIARGVQPPRGFSNRQITGLYLMGSVGSLAQARSSDLDVWLCYDESLDNGQLSALGKKCELIERWAESQNVELHFFLMNLSDFRRGQSQSAQGEDCGSTQHLLLLDEITLLLVSIALLLVSIALLAVVVEVTITSVIATSIASVIAITRTRITSLPAIIIVIISLSLGASVWLRW
jgi:adenylate cyclase class 1